jgi:hypothetical protein
VQCKQSKRRGKRHFKYFSLFLRLSKMCAFCKAFRVSAHVNPHDDASQETRSDLVLDPGLLRGDPGPFHELAVVSSSDRSFSPSPSLMVACGVGRSRHFSAGIGHFASSQNAGRFEDWVVPTPVPPGDAHLDHLMESVIRLRCSILAGCLLDQDAGCKIAPVAVHGRSAREISSCARCLNIQRSVSVGGC